MRVLSAWSILGLCIFLITPLHAAESGAEEEPISIAVMEFASKADCIEQEKMDALSDMAANVIREAGAYKVIGKDDIRATLSFEQQKTIMGCSDESCIAEVGGALGVRFIVVGNLSRFGKSFLLNMKLIDVAKVEVLKGVSRTIPGKEEKLVAELPGVARELLRGLKKDQPKGVGADLQDYVSERAGVVPLTVSLGLVGMVPPYATNDGFDGTVMDGLNKGLVGARLSVFAGYGLLDWLVMGPKLSLVTAGDTKGERVRNCLVGALEIQGTVPLDYWVRPVVSVAGGLGKMWDKDKEGGGDLGDLDSIMVNLEMAVGVDFLFGGGWVLGSRVGAFLDIYTSVHDESGTRIDTRVMALGLTALVNVGYEF